MPIWKENAKMASLSASLIVGPSLRARVQMSLNARQSQC